MIYKNRPLQIYEHLFAIVRFNEQRTPSISGHGEDAAEAVCEDGLPNGPSHQTACNGALNT